jgi:hypothetical protein
MEQSSSICNNVTEEYAGSSALLEIPPVHYYGPPVLIAQQVTSTLGAINLMEVRHHTEQSNTKWLFFTMAVVCFP